MQDEDTEDYDSTAPLWFAQTLVWSSAAAVLLFLTAAVFLAS